VGQVVEHERSRTFGRCLVVLLNVEPDRGTVGIFKGADSYNFREPSPVRQVGHLKAGEVASVGRPGF
jgi:hypothetical protein